MAHIEFVETADVGIRVRAASPEDGFRSAAEAMFDLLVPNRAQVESREEWSISASGSDWDNLLAGWLEELLFCFQTEHMVAASITFSRLEPTALDARIMGERFDAERHEEGVPISRLAGHTVRMDGAFQLEVLFAT